MPTLPAKSSILDLINQIGTYNFSPQRRGGFTIIETIIAIAILLLAITPPLTLAEKSLASAEAARHEVTALYLLQEGQEFIKNIRDENVIIGKGGGPDWLLGLTDCILSEGNKKGGRKEEGGCGVDPTASQGKQVIKCGEPNGYCTLKQYVGVSPKEITGIFSYDKENRGSGSEWKETTFQRRIFIKELVEDKEAVLTVELNWTAGSLGERTLEVHTNLFNWYSAE